MMKNAKSTKAQKSKKTIGAVRYSYNSQPVPDEARVTLRYTETLDANASVGIYVYSFGANDIYDPNITGTGAQPAYYDQWCGLYQAWLVPELEYDVAVTSRTVSGRLSVAVAPNTSTSYSPANFDAASSLRMAKAAETTGGGPTVHIRGRVSMAKLYGVPDYAYEADDNFSGSINASPNRRLPLTIACETSGASDALSLTVVLKYKVRFYRPLVASQSLHSRVPAAIAAAPSHCCTTYTRCCDAHAGMLTQCPLPAERVLSDARPGMLTQRLVPGESAPSGGLSDGNPCVCHPRPL